MRFYDKFSWVSFKGKDFSCLENFWENSGVLTHLILVKIECILVFQVNQYTR